MTQDYANATTHTLDLLLGVSKNRQFVFDQVKEISKANLQGLDIQPRETNTNVKLLYSGEEFAELCYASVWTIERESLSLEVPLAVKEAWEKYKKGDEYLETLQTILVYCYKDEAIKQFPALKQLFAKTDERLKAEEQQILDDWKAIKEDLEAFYN
jgi:exonuclease VII small subunit